MKIEPSRTELFVKLKITELNQFFIIDIVTVEKIIKTKRNRILKLLKPN